MSRPHANEKWSGLLIVWAMSLAFLAASFVSKIGDANSAMFGTGVLQAVLAEPIWGTRLAIELMRFVVMLVLIHSCLAVAAWFMGRLTVTAWPGAPNSQRVFAVLWLVVLIGWIMTANAYWYPRTALGNPYDHIASAQFFGVSVFSLFTLIAGAAIVVTAACALIRRFGRILRSRQVWIGGTALLAAGVALPAINVLGSSDHGSDPDRPHVILIGIDSLRTDFVLNDAIDLTPAINDFMTDAVSFSSAYTPLARTFPAWVSIVSGRHPHSTGAFVNLLPRDLIDEGTTMPSTLAENGYQTIYAIDEVRFSNLDESYGFDRMLAPSMGAADFMLGFFADTPLANILVNTAVGNWLFPYGYANRAAANIYDPDTFIERIDAGVDFDRPTMLAVHFTLAHWPYTWASFPDISSPDGRRRTSDELSRIRYELAVERVDRQFERLMQLLAEKRALDNAIVVVLSDHGESLGEESPLYMQDEMLDSLLGNESLMGHGTHVFSGDQYNVLLGVRAFGNEMVASAGGAVRSAPVSLIDIAPTVLDILDLDSHQEFDGQSFGAYLGSRSPNVQNQSRRIRFLETEFNPPGISPDMIMATSAISTAAEKYRVDPDTDLIQVRVEFLDEMLAKRQYAAELNGTILASIPAANFRKQHLVLFDPETGAANWIERRPTPVDDPTLFELWTALENRFDAVVERPLVPRPMVAEQSH